MCLRVKTIHLTGAVEDHVSEGEDYIPYRSC